MYKLNILPVKLLDTPISKNKQIFSHEPCDVCGTQGIVYEAVAYQGGYDVYNFLYFNYTYKNYKKLIDTNDRHWIKLHYITYYLCSKECGVMLQLQLED